MTKSKAKLQEVYAESDKIMLMVIIFLLLFTMALATVHDTWNIALLIGVPTALIPIALILTLPGQILTRVMVSVSFMVFAALHIQQMSGMIELHFGIFVLLAFLLYYRDWTVIVIAAAVIAIHHLAFNFLQAAGYPVFVFDHGPSLPMVFTHAAYVVFQSGLLIYMAVQSAKEAQRSVELQEITTNFVINNGMINLTSRQQNPDSDFANDFNNFMSSINQAIAQSQQVANQLTITSNKLQTLSHDTKQGTELEKNNSDMIANAIKNMASSLLDVAENSKNAASVAQNAEQLVKTGSQVVNQTIGAFSNLANSVEQASNVIQKLETHTSQIGTVLDVIKGIADQTNLLALNAAIEAARAGEQGRGFAVVADEVRTLASRTQQSTQDIQKMIQELQSQSQTAVKVMRDGQEHAQQGVQQASNTSEAFNSISQSVVDINTLNAQIANASHQQSIVADQILKHIQQIAQIASENTLSVNSLDHVCMELVDFSNELKTLVGKFKV